MNSVHANDHLDCLGLFCPNPIMQTSLRMKKLKQGEVLEVVADDETFPKDIPDWCGKMGYELISIHEENGEFHAYIKRP